MTNTHCCLLCGKEIGMWDKTCKYCGEKQFGENNEFFPDEKAKQMLTFKAPKSKKKKQGLTIEEIFFAKMHPDDEMYRKTLEFEILTKKRQRT